MQGSRRRAMIKSSVCLSDEENQRGGLAKAVFSKGQDLHFPETK